MVKKMELIKTIEIPEGIEAKIENNEVTIKGPLGELKRRFPNFLIITKEENKIVVTTEKKTKKEKKEINTNAAHIKNMILGVMKKFVYKLQICAVHFPMNVSVQGSEIIIKNFLGERKDRKTNILPNVDVKIEKDIITVESNNKESAGQTAANIEKKSKVRCKDRRIFQDGIFMIEKAGRAI